MLNESADSPALSRDNGTTNPTLLHSREFFNGLLGLVSLVTTLPFGQLVDKVRPRTLLAATGFAMSAACVAYAFSGPSLGIQLFGVAPKLLGAHAAYGLLALSQGMLFLLASPIFARYFGRRHHGAIRGSLTSFMVVGTSAGPFVFAFWRDLAGGFEQVCFASALASAVLGGWATQLRPPASRQAAVDEKRRHR